MSSHGLSKLAVAIGGFLIFVGTILIGVFAMILLDVIDVGVLQEVSGTNAYHMLFLGVLLLVGVLDLVSGIILRYG